MSVSILRNNEFFYVADSLFSLGRDKSFSHRLLAPCPANPQAFPAPKGRLPLAVARINAVLVLDVAQIIVIDGVNRIVTSCFT